VHNLFLVYLSISTCFGQLCAQHQEKQLCLCDTWYLLFCVDDCLVRRLEPTYQTVIIRRSNFVYVTLGTCSVWRLTNILGINCAPSWLYLQENITVFSLYIMFTPTCFDTSVSSSGSLKNLSFIKLHKFFKLKLLKLQFHKIIRLKLFGCRWVIQ